MMDPVHINSSTAHTLSVTLQCSMLTNFKALVKTPVLHDTLVKKCITKILKCFTILPDPVLQPEDWQ
jgi:hypothetical protein